jgi:hypothetical protein
MAGYRAFLLLLLTMLVTSMACGPGAAQIQVLGPISEETPPAVCWAGWFVSGIRCTGRYCDNIEITCTKIPGGTVGADHRWTPWVSEKRTSTAWCGPGPNLIAGFACSGRYCDNISLYADPLLDDEVRVRRERRHAFVSERDSERDLRRDPNVVLRVILRQQNLRSVSDQIALAPSLKAAALGILGTERVVARGPVGIGPVRSVCRVEDAVAADASMIAFAASTVADCLPRHPRVSARPSWPWGPRASR